MHSLNWQIPWFVFCNTNSRQYTANGFFKLILIKNTEKQTSQALM